MYAAAEGLLSALVRYHHLTRSMPAFLQLICATIRHLLPADLGEDVSAAVYNAVSEGPLRGDRIRYELGDAFNYLAAGSQGHHAWSQAIEELLDSVNGLLLLPSRSTSAKRSRPTIGVQPSIVAAIALNSHLLVVAVGNSQQSEATKRICVKFNNLVAELELLDEKKQMRRKEGSSMSHSYWAETLLYALQIRAARIAKQNAVEISAESMLTLQDRMERGGTSTELDIEIVRSFIATIFNTDNPP
jgi:hypothetical protein